MKKIYLLSILGLMLLFPHLTHAAGNANISGLVFKESVAAVGEFKAFKASVGDTPILVIFNNSTKFLNQPVGMVSVSDWQLGDQISVSGDLSGYNNNLLTIKALEVKFLTKDVTIVKQEQVVENLDKNVANNTKLVLSYKDTNKYSLTMIEHFGQVGGPRIGGGVNVDLFVPGTTISLTMIRRKNGTVITNKIVEVSKTTKPLSVSKRLLDVVKVNNQYVLNPALVSPINLVKKNQLIFQNYNSGLIYLKNTDGLKRIFSLSSGDGYFLVKGQGYLVKNTAALDENVDLEFYTGTYVSGKLNNPVLVLTVHAVVKN